MIETARAVICVTIKGHTLDKLFEKFGDGDLWHWWWDYKPLTSTSWLIKCGPSDGQYRGLQRTSSILDDV